MEQAELFITLATVEGVNPETKEVSLYLTLWAERPAPEITYMVTTYAPVKMITMERLDVSPTDNPFSVPVGDLTYPQPGDILLVAVARSASHMGRYSKFVSKVTRQVYILGKVFSKRETRVPKITLPERLWLDRSGAKIHINHIWNDVSTVEVEGETQTSHASGHLTVVGNRTVIVVGSKFTGWGLHSHLLGISDDPETWTADLLGDEDASPYLWSQLFTRDLATNEDALYDPRPGAPTEYRPPPKFTPTTDWWLEPPSVPPGSYMVVHQSGSKWVLDNTEGFEGQSVLFSRASICYIGTVGRFLSFDPINEYGHGFEEHTEMATHPDGVDTDGDQLVRWLASDDGLALAAVGTWWLDAKDATPDYCLGNLELGGLYVSVPTTLPTTLAADLTPDQTSKLAEKGKVKIKVGTIEVVVDGTPGSEQVLIDIEGDGTPELVVDATGVTFTPPDGTFTIDGDLTVTGSVQVDTDLGVTGAGAIDGNATIGTAGTSTVTIKGSAVEIGAPDIKMNPT